MVATFPIGGKVHWTYRCLPCKARCRIEGKRLKLRIVFQADLEAVPDVLIIEEAVRQLTDEPTTVEELAVNLHKRIGLPVGVAGKTKTHGVIKAVVA